MRIAPFQALLPPPAFAQEVACPPYDTVDAAEAAALAAGKPRCFLHVTRAEIDLPPTLDPHADAVYAQAARTMQRFLREGSFVPAPQRALYVYRITKGAHAQTGVVACCHVEDYEQNVIRKHEKTRTDKENDRLRHILAIRAHAGPVFLTYRDRADIDARVAASMQGAPLLRTQAEDGSVHEVWPCHEGAEALQAAFATVPQCYIADGHHRAAAAVRAARQLREAAPAGAAAEASDWFLGVLFPATQLRILPYNRCVRDLNGLSADAFLQRVAGMFRVTPGAPAVPAGQHQASMYLAGTWYGIAWPPPADADPVATLDVSVLQDRLLAPVLGIDDPRTSARIEFVGGIRGVEALAQRVDAGKAAVAFSMYPVTVEEMMRIADADRIMPPKSTWFEPKLRSGMVVHGF